MYYEKFMLLIMMFQLQICKGAMDRDILLTSKELMFSRTFFNNPSSYETSETVPWETPLKHFTFLTLFGEAGSHTSLSELQEYKEFMHAPYKKVHGTYVQFGDIITLARGWVVNLNGYSFQEGPCKEICFNKALAIWKVQKIRNRNPQNGFPYEIKFSVTPLNNKVLRKNLNILSEHSDDIEHFSNERQARIVNYDPGYDFINNVTLNIGEIFKEIPKALSKVGYLSSSRSSPNYETHFTNPEAYKTKEGKRNVLMHHLHHHYIIKNEEASTSRNYQLYPGNRGAIRVIESPSAQLLLNQYTLTTTTEAPREVIDMHQLPFYKPSFSNKEMTSRSFKKSEQLEEIRYSEPDPLYENVNNRKKESSYNFGDSTESISDEANSHQKTSILEPSSLIIEKFTQQSDGRGILHPYILDMQEITPTMSLSSTSYITRSTILPKNKFLITPTIVKKSSETLTSHANNWLPNYIQSKTEQPVMKWTTKSELKEKSNTTVHTNIENNFVTITPSKELEVLTAKSVSP